MIKPCVAIIFAFLTAGCAEGDRGVGFGARSNFTRYENVPIPKGDPRGIKCGRECQEWLVRP